MIPGCNFYLNLFSVFVAVIKNICLKEKNKNWNLAYRVAQSTHQMLSRIHSQYFIHMPFDSSTIFTFPGTKSVDLLIVSTGKGSNVLLTRAENSVNV